MTPDDTNPEELLRLAQLEELRLKNEKLQLELNELRKGKPWHQILIQFVPVLTALIAFAGFFWGDSMMNDLSHKLGTAMHDSMAATAAMTFEKFASEQFKYK